MNSINCPNVGEVWESQGGIYAGLTCDPQSGGAFHLILATARPDKGLVWSAALEWAAWLTHMGHVDWHAPTRFESALLYANLRNEMDLGVWHWTSTQYSDRFAYIQSFFSGYQICDNKSYEARVRAVRRVPVAAAPEAQGGGDA